MALPIMTFRLPWAALRGLRKPPIALLDPVRMRLRVQPNDIDLYGHVNNGRYLTLMDLGRTEWSARSGLLRLFRKRGWLPVVAGATIRYRRELRLLRPYTLTTRLAGWDDEWFFFEQQIDDHRDDLSARAYLKIAVLDEQRKRMSPAPVVAALGFTGAAPELPAGVRAWLASDAS